jgi:hypothetical protein
VKEVHAGPVAAGALVVAAEDSGEEDSDLGDWAEEEPDGDAASSLPPLLPHAVASSVATASRAESTAGRAGRRIAAD